MADPNALRELSRYEFGPFTVDPAQGFLYRDGELVPLTPKVFETLLVLIEHGGRMVTREAMMARIWPDTIVSDTSLTQNIWLVRKALGEEQDGVRYIDTVPRRGYRFLVPVRRVATAPASVDARVEPAVKPVDPLDNVTRHPSASFDRAAVIKAAQDSRRRRIVIGAISVAVVLAIVIAGAIVLRRRATPATPFTRTAAVVRMRPALATSVFRSDAGREPWLRTALPRMIADELSATEQLRVVAAETNARMQSELALPDVDGFTPATLGRIRDYSGADLLLSGSYDEVMDGGEPKVRFTARVQEIATGEIIATASQSGRTSEIFDLVRSAGQSLRTSLAVDHKGQPAAVIAADAPHNVEAARLYAQGLELVHRNEYASAIPLLEKASTIEPANALVHRTLADVFWKMGYGTRSRESAKQAQALAKSLPRAQQLEIDALLAQANQDRPGVVAIRESLWRFYPDDVNYALDLATALANAGRADDGLKVIAKVRQLPPPANADPKIDLVEANVFSTLGKFDKQLAAATAGLQKVERIGAKTLVARASLLQSLALRRLERPEAREATLRTLKLSRESGYVLGEVRALITLATDDQDAKRFDAAHASLDEAARIAERTGDANGLLAARMTSAIVAGDEGKFEQAISAFNGGITLARQMGDQSNEVTLLNNRGEMFANLGQLPAARADFDAAISVARRIGRKTGLAAALMNIAHVDFDAGRIADAQREAREGFETTQQTGAKKREGRAALVFADIVAAAGDVTQARSLYERAAELAGGDDAIAARSTLAFANAAAGEKLDLSPVAQPFDPKTAERKSLVARARLLALAGRGPDAATAARAASAKVDGKVSAAEKLSTATTDAYAQAIADRSRARSSFAQLQRTRSEAARSGLVAEELEATLGACRVSHFGALPEWRSTCQDVARRAKDRGFALIARQAEHELASR